MRTPAQLEEIRWQVRMVNELGGKIRIEYHKHSPQPWWFRLPARNGFADSYYQFKTLGQCCAMIHRFLAPVEAFTVHEWGHPWYDGTGKSIYGGAKDGVA